MGNWKTRLIEAAHKAEDTLDMFVSSAIIKTDFNDNNNSFKDPFFDSDDEMPAGSVFKTPFFIDNIFSWSLLDLKDVMDDLKSFEQEIMSNYHFEKGYLLQNHLDKRQDMMMEDNKTEATGPCSSRNTRVNVSATEHELLIVGFDEDALLILDRLTADRKKLDIISVVGMGGLGKTTLATKIFHDSLVEYHFDMRGWITVSQAYSKRDMLVQLLASIGKSVHAATSESKLCEMLYQRLKGRRYLIIIDDIWSCKAWDDVGQCFPNDNNGSRVLVKWVSLDRIER
ncbi:putative P-loop containing nucleoside triphosphate hydrolase [Helianthus debilis subsp. tardiflorus]